MYQISLGQIPWDNLFKNLIFYIFDQLLQFWLFLLFCSLQTTIFYLGGCYSCCLTLSLISLFQMYFKFLNDIFDLLMPFFNFEIFVKFPLAFSKAMPNLDKSKNIFSWLSSFIGAEIGADNDNSWLLLIFDNNQCQHKFCVKSVCVWIICDHSRKTLWQKAELFVFGLSLFYWNIYNAWIFVMCWEF